MSLNVIYYNSEPLSESSVLSMNEGGRCKLEAELEDCLQALAVAGRGRFHHFRVSGSCEGDDISELTCEIMQALEYLETGKDILEDYREFCCRVSFSPHFLYFNDACSCRLVNIL